MGKKPLSLTSLKVIETEEDQTAKLIQRIYLSFTYSFNCEAQANNVLELHCQI